MKRAFGGIDQNSGRSSEDIMGGGWALLDAWPQLCELETCCGTQHQRDDQWFADALMQRSHAQIRQLFASRTLGCYPFNIRRHCARLSSFNVEIQGVGNLSISSEAAFSHWQPQSLMLAATSILRTMNCDGEEVNSKESGELETWKLYEANQFAINWRIRSYLIILGLPLDALYAHWNRNGNKCINGSEFSLVMGLIQCKPAADAVENWRCHNWGLFKIFGRDKHQIITSSMLITKVPGLSPYPTHDEWEALSSICSCCRCTMVTYFVIVQACSSHHSDLKLVRKTQWLPFSHLKGWGTYRSLA